jgi:PAS domain S-box-containing protein
MRKERQGNGVEQKHDRGLLESFENWSLIKKVLDNMPIGIALLDTRFLVRSFNKIFGDYVEQYTSSKFTEILGSSIFDYIPNNRDQAEGCLKSALESGKPSEFRNYELTFSCAGRKSTAYWDVHVVPLLDRDGETTFVLLILHDVTLQKKQKDELKMSEKLYRTIFEATGTASIIIENDTTISMMNSECERLWGYKKEEVEGKKSWRDFVAEPEDLMRMNQYHVLRRVDPSLAPSKYEFKFIDKYGNLKDVLVTIGVIPGTKQHVASMLDVTESKQIEEKLKHSNEQLRALAAHLQSIREEERDMLAREIHDELGQLLTKLKIDIWRLYKKVDSDIQVHLGKMLSLVDETTEFVHKIAKKLKPSILDDLGLVSAAEWLVNDFQTRSGIICDFSSNMSDIDLGTKRSVALFRILQEALTNIVRHAKASNVEVVLHKNGDNVILKVSDNGRGITQGEINNKNSMGLMGIKERAILFGGEAIIEGAKGKGTTLTVRIPVRSHVESVQNVYKANVSMEGKVDKDSYSR